MSETFGNQLFELDTVNLTCGQDASLQLTGLSCAAPSVLWRSGFARLGWPAAGEACLSVVSASLGLGMVRRSVGLATEGSTAAGKICVR